MKGQVDSSGRALVTISVWSSGTGVGRDIQAWIDTAFNGDPVLSERQIRDLGLIESGTIKAVLADGSQVTLERYLCHMDWFGERRELEIVANQGEYALLGVGLLLGHDLHISYQSGEITIA